ncbi:MAG: desulfoferrodoxin family protein [Tissierellia bacterium]|nr:desulfoferrodoxin family protein [Tissierellia bacterium]
MAKLTSTVQSGDWKNEKHVPVIHAEKAEGRINFEVSIGEEIGHPNTLEHYIAWIKVFFQPEGAKFPIEVGSYEFKAHGEEEVFSLPEVKSAIQTDKAGTLTALSYCNIHGLWENELEVK